MQGIEVPDMLPLNIRLPCDAKDGEPPGFSNSSQLARDLTRAACEGADPPLAWALPHTNALRQLQKAGASRLTIV
jgi:hypothetical protein